MSPATAPAGLWAVQRRRRHRAWKTVALCRSRRTADLLLVSLAAAAAEMGEPHDLDFRTKRVRPDEVRALVVPEGAAP
jgi:hypothetical protein